MKYTKILLATAVTCCLASNAFGETFKVKARSGAKQQVMSQWVYDADCHSYNYSKIGFRQPANGKLSFVKKKVRVPKGKKCAGKLLNGFIIYYKSRAGFRGQDRGRAYFTIKGGRTDQTSNARFVINVK